MTDDTTRKIREHLAATLAILERDITEEKVLSYLKPAQIARALAAAYEEAGEAFRLVGGTDADIEAAARMPAVDKDRLRPGAEPWSEWSDDDVQ